MEQNAFNDWLAETRSAILSLPPETHTQLLSLLDHNLATRQAILEREHRQIVRRLEDEIFMETQHESSRGPFGGAAPRRRAPQRRRNLSQAQIATWLRNKSRRKRTTPYPYGPIMRSLLKYVDTGTLR
jgi:hypothetical protein